MFLLPRCENVGRRVGQTHHVEIIQISHIFVIKVDGETKLTLMNNYLKDYTTAKFFLYDDYAPYAKLSNLKIKLPEKQQGND